MLRWAASHNTRAAFFRFRGNVCVLCSDQWRISPMSRATPTPSVATPTPSVASSEGIVSKGAAFRVNVGLRPEMWVFIIQKGRAAKVNIQDFLQIL